MGYIIKKYPIYWLQILITISLQQKKLITIVNS